MVVPYPGVTMVDHLKQAASDIVKILGKPPLTTVASLQAGDPVRNSWLELGILLGRVESIL